MQEAYVCLNCQSGHEKKIIEKLNQLPNVKETHGTLGVYDIIARVESDSLGTMKSMIMDKIRRIDGVTATMTLVGLQDMPEADDLIPDVIPEEKRPLEPPGEDFEEDDYDDEDDYEESKKAET